MSKIFADLFDLVSVDISWFDTLHALASGSTLCVPSESERRDDLDGSIARFEATSVFLTPSVARLIHPHTVPSLELLALGGEPQRWSDFSGWPEHIQKVSVYGPCECTVVSSAEDARILEKRDMTLPAGIGLNTWLADPANPRLLAPIGAVGEIWLEGEAHRMPTLKPLRPVQAFTNRFQDHSSEQDISAMSRGPQRRSLTILSGCCEVASMRTQAVVDAPIGRAISLD